MVGEACLPSNAYYSRTPDYTLHSEAHVCWSEHSDSPFVYGFMSSRLRYHDHYYVVQILDGNKLELPSDLVQYSQTKQKSIFICLLEGCFYLQVLLT